MVKFPCVSSRNTVYFFVVIRRVYGNSVLFPYLLHGILIVVNILYGTMSRSSTRETASSHIPYIDFHHLVCDFQAILFFLHRYHNISYRIIPSYSSRLLHTFSILLFPCTFYTFEGQIIIIITVLNRQ